MKKTKCILLGLAVPAAVLVFWYIATTFTGVPNTILPKISSVVLTGGDMIHTGQLPADLGISIGRVVKGFLASAVIGIILGSAMGMSQTVNALFHPFITTIRQIPMIA